MKLVEIIRERKLPYAGDIVVKVGDRVEAEQVVAKMNYYPGLVHKINIAKKLAIDSEDIDKVIIVKQGQLINKGDVIALNSHWNQAQVIASPQTGIVGMVSKHLGQLYIRKLTKFKDTKFETHDVNKLLDSKGKQSKKTIGVRVGQNVIPNQVVAYINHNSNTFKTRSLKTEIYGEVTSIKNNIVTIKNTQVSSSIKAYLSGEVVKVNPKSTVIIKSNAYLINGVYGLGSEKSGVLRVVEGADLKAEDILESDEGKVLITKGHLSKEVLYKANEVKASAIISASCDLAVVRKYAGDKFIPGITGSEEVNTGLILLKGFKQNVINEELWEQITKLNNSLVSVNGTTHIRAGAIRPEVIIFPNSRKG